MLLDMVEDEEIERAIRRDPRWLVRVSLVIAAVLLAGALGLISLGRLRIGERVARGFATLTEAPPPSGNHQ